MSLSPSQSYGERWMTNFTPSDLLLYTLVQLEWWRFLVNHSQSLCPFTVSNLSQTSFQHIHINTCSMWLTNVFISLLFFSSFLLFETICSTFFICRFLFSSLCKLFFLHTSIHKEQRASNSAHVRRLSRLKCLCSTHSKSYFHTHMRTTHTLAHTFLLTWSSSLRVSSIFRSSRQACLLLSTNEHVSVGRSAGLSRSHQNTHRCSLSTWRHCNPHTVVLLADSHTLDCEMFMRHLEASVRASDSWVVMKMCNVMKMQTCQVIG